MVEASPEDHSLWNREGTILAQAGRSEEALKAFSKAIEAARSNRVNRVEGEALLNRSDLLWRLGRRAESVADWREVLRSQPALRPDEVEDRALKLLLGPAEERDPERALVLAEAIRPDGDRTEETPFFYGMALYQSGQFVQARGALLDAARYQRELSGECFLFLALASEQLRDRAAAQYYFERAMQQPRAQVDFLFDSDWKKARELLGGKFLEGASRMAQSASAFLQQGKIAEAAARYREAAAMQMKELGEAYPGLAVTLRRLGAALKGLGDSRAAQTAYCDALAIQKRVLGSEHGDVADTLLNLAELLLEGEKNPKEAEIMAQEGLAIYEKERGSGWRLQQARLLMGRCLTAQRRFDEAEAVLLSSYEDSIRRSSIADMPTGQQLARLYEEWGNPDKAAEWRAKLRPRTP